MFINIIIIYFLLSLACHKSCTKCSGPGSEKCTECSSGYKMTEQGCEGTLLTSTLFLVKVTFFEFSIEFFIENIDEE